MKRQWSTIKILLWIILCLSVTALTVLFILNFRYLSTHFTENNPHGELFKVVLTVIAGIIAIVALYYNHRRVTAIEKGNVDTRFNNAVGHLGSENPTVVLGGIHALHQIAVKDENYTQVVHDLFCSYLRENSAKLYDEKTLDKCPVIIQTLIDYLFKSYNGKDLIYKSYASDLSYSILKNCIFRGATFENCNFRGATLTKSDFYDTTLTECDFSNVTLAECDFCGVTLTECGFGCAILTKCDFKFATLAKCNFYGATLTKCGFHNAILTKSNFYDTVLTECDFSRAELFSCYGLDSAKLIAPYGLKFAKLIDTELPSNENTQSETETQN